MTLSFSRHTEFYEYIGVQGYTSNHSLHLKSYFKKHLAGRSFESPVKLQVYIKGVSSGGRHIAKTARTYLTFCERTGVLSRELILRYREMLKPPSCRTDVRVPANVDVLGNYELVRKNKKLELVYLVLATSGIRLVECLEWLKTYDPARFTFHNEFVSYPVAYTRGKKNTNNIYIPAFVYERLFHVQASYNAIRQEFMKKHCTFTLKYLRKWQYNFMLYQGVPESVADFVQGRSGHSVSANHHLAKSQQADFWYAKVAGELSHLQTS